MENDRVFPYVTLLQQLLLPVPKGPIKEAMAVLQFVFSSCYLRYHLEMLIQDYSFHFTLL